MNKKIIIAIIILIVLAGVGVILFLSINKDDNNPKTTDADKFYAEYPGVGKDNAFVYRSKEEIIKILENGTGVVFFGYSSCVWCQEYVPMLSEVAKIVELEKIYYFDINEERENKTEVYQKIVKILDDRLPYDEEGNRRVTTPFTVFVLNGEIVGHNNQSSELFATKDGTPQEWWTEKRRQTLKEELKNYMDELYSESCDSSC